MAQRQINILRNYRGIIDRYAIFVMGYGKVSQYGLRIYMSSIFTDMALEKAALFSEVYPKLKEYCREHYGLEFQVRLFFYMMHYRLKTHFSTNNWPFYVKKA